VHRNQHGGLGSAVSLQGLGLGGIEQEPAELVDAAFGHL
jgi:hypothetical protein